MHIFNSLHILIPNLLLHSRRVALSAVNLHLLFSAVLIESLFPGCNWITQDLLEHFLSISMKEFQAGKLPVGG